MQTRVRVEADRAIGAPNPGDDTCTVADLDHFIATGRRFGTIYADPPWVYDNQGTRTATGNHYGGRIVDGRNRFLACRKAGVSCYRITFDGDERRLVELSISKNVHRRHLSESQRTMIAAEVANLPNGVCSVRVGPPIGGASPISSATAAQMLNVGSRTAERARNVLRNGSPELVAAVRSGNVTVNAAEDLLSLDHDQQRERLQDVTKPRSREPGEKRQQPTHLVT